MTLHGTGTAEIVAFGIADAEASLEKELLKAAPGAELQIIEIRPPGGEPRIVQTYSASFRLRLKIELEASTHEDARRKAFTTGRHRLATSRFRRVVWERAEVHP